MGLIGAIKGGVKSAQAIKQASKSVQVVQSSLLSGTVGVITGSGIGAKAVECFAAAGAKVIYATDVNDKGFSGLEKGMKALGFETTVIYVKVDVSKEDEVEALVRRVVKEQGRLDWFFANAGIIDYEAMPQTKTSGMHKLVDINTFGAWHCVQWAARGMMNTSAAKPNPGGSIVVTTSLAGVNGQWGTPSYTISKHAAVGLVHTAAANFTAAGCGIRINGVAPGPTLTNIGSNSLNLGNMSSQARNAVVAAGAKMTDDSRAFFSNPAEIAQTAVFLASDMASAICGENIIADHGMNQMPVGLSGLMYKPVFEPL